MVPVQKSCYGWTIIGVVVLIAIVLVSVITATPGPSVAVDPQPIDYRSGTIPGQYTIANEIGLTRWFFHCRPWFEYDSSVLPGGHSATIKIKRAGMKIGLTIQRLLPANASADLRSHEEGHVEICQRIYDEAPGIALACCRLVLGKEFTGYGTDEQSALQSAQSAAAESVCRKYVAQTSAKVDSVSSRYDIDTVHGHQPAALFDAVEQAFRDDQESPQTAVH